jgi:predicted ester cyclase
MADLTAHAKNVVEAFNNADWDAARGLIGDSTYNELGTQRSLAGADAIIEALQGWKAAMPDVKGTVTSAVESGQRVVLEVTWEGTQTGEMVTEQGTIPPVREATDDARRFRLRLREREAEGEPQLLRPAHLPEADRSRVSHAARFSAGASDLSRSRAIL